MPHHGTISSVLLCSSCSCPCHSCSCAAAAAAAADPTDDTLDYGGIRLAAYFLLILPGVWLLGAAVYVVRGCCQRRRALLVRARRKEFLEGFIVTYHAVGAAPGTTGQDASNAAKARAAAARSGGAEAKESEDEVLQRSSAAGGGGSGAVEVGVEMMSVDVRTGARHGEYAPLTGGAAADSSARQQSSSSGGAHMSPAAALVLSDDEDGGESHGVASPSAVGAGSALPPVSAGSAGGSAAAAAAVPELGGVGVNARGQTLKITGSACAICLTDYEEGERLKVLPCKHAFHIGCIDPWLERSEECAVCRASVNEAMQRMFQICTPHFN